MKIMSGIKNDERGYNANRPEIYRSTSLEHHSLGARWIEL